jgi:hypothetical protein
MTGATIKRAAVQNPNMVDFGGDVETVDFYDLSAAEAGMDHPGSSGDVTRDREIDAIVNKITGDEGNKPAAAPAVAGKPAGPAQTGDQASQPTEGQGTTSLINNETKADEVSSEPAATGESATLTAAVTEMVPAAGYQSGPLPKPRWRREHDEKVAKEPARHALPRGL